MNKCIRNNWKVFNKIRFTPIQVPTPEGLDHINQWCENVWNHLVNDDVERKAYYNIKGKHGFTISVWTDSQYVYIVQCIRSEYNTDDTMIYMQNLTEDNLNDFLAIAKFMRYNIKGIIGHSKQGFIELNKMKAALELQKELNKPDGVA